MYFWSICIQKKYFLEVPKLENVSRNMQMLIICCVHFRCSSSFVGFCTAVKRGGMLGLPPPSCPLRLCGIIGYDGRINDTVYCYPTVRSDQQTAVVFFGGDVQVLLHKFLEGLYATQGLVTTKPQTTV